MAANKKKTVKAQKARKQKMILIIGGALLVVVLAIQAPRIMKMVHGGGGETSAAPYKAFPGAVLQAGRPEEVAVSTSGTVVLPDADPDPEPGTGQLVDFALFPSKDPFVQQVKEHEDGEGTAGAADQPAKNGGQESSGGFGDSAGSGDGQTVEAAPSSATISVNGTSESVAVGGKFPSEDPAFVLVSATSSSAKIGIAGGSLSSGDQTVTLRRGHSLTLVNTVDGTEYHLTLISSK
jgi:hypothetical protein